MEKTHLTIIDYLARNCAEDIARTFYDELDIKPEYDFDEVFKRKAIREALNGGKYDDALELLSSYYPTISVHKPDLHIDILIARLVRTIQHDSDALRVVTTARNDIVPIIERLPKVEDRQQHFGTLNKAMSLLIRADADATQVWTSTSIYVSSEKLAQSILLRLEELSGTKPRAEARLFDQLLRTHRWAEEMQENEIVVDNQLIP